MSYTIRNADGTILLSLADNTVDRTTTSLALVGRNIRSYGEYFNNNLIQILSNSANTAGNPPRNPLKGQIWYNTTNKRLQVFDNVFKPISGAIISGDQPSDLFTGDLWFDSTNNQLKLYSGNVAYLVGPVYPKSAGETGWVLPSVSIKDKTSAPRQVILLKAYGQFIGIASKTEFDLSSNDSLTYFNTSKSVTAVSGLTILGDIKYTGHITNTHLSMSIDLDKTDAAGPGIGFNDQNDTIMSYLGKMFPANANSVTNDAGLMIGTEARVMCTGFAIPPPGTQVRRFYVGVDPADSTIKQWKAYNGGNNIL